MLLYSCNYADVGLTLDLDLLKNPNLVAEQEDVAVGTTVSFFSSE